MTDDLVGRLREVSGTLTYGQGVDERTLWVLAPEQIKNGLEAMKRAKGCDRNTASPRQAIFAAGHCSGCWDAMLDAFIQGATDAER